MSIIIKDNGTIIIKDDECWMCGTKKELTNHHAIPQTHNPKKNVEIKVCRRCHNKIHDDNLNSIIGFLTRTKKELEKTAGRLNMGMTRLENYTEKRTEGERRVK